MKQLWIDTETWSEVPLKNGTHRYVEGVEVLLTAYAFDDGPVQVVEGVPFELQDWIDEAEEVVLHNSRFDRTVLKALGYDIPEWKIHDTLVRARAHSLPGGLDQLCTIFKVDADLAKHKGGKQLIHLFCKPRPKNMVLRRATKDTHPTEWARFVEYAGADITSMRELYRKMPSWNYRSGTFERALWELDQEINDRGFAVDVAFAEAAVAAIEIEKKRLKREVNDATDGAVESATQREAMLRHLRLLIVAAREDGDYSSAAGRVLLGGPLPDDLDEFEEALRLALPDMQKGTLERRVGDPDLPEFIRGLIAMRLEASSTSVSKYKRLGEVVSSDGRLRGGLEFCGAARTGRWSGRLFQPQNLPRPSHSREEIEETIDAVLAGTADILYDDVTARLSSAIRSVIVPAPGKVLLAADLSNIEGRVLAWLAGEEWKLDAFREFDAGTGPDLYKLAYARSFGKAVEDVTKDDRQIGKVQELALGYQGAVGAFSSMAALYGINLSEDEVLRVVRGWREANPRIVKFWYRLEDAAVKAVLNPRKVFQAEQIKIDRVGVWMRVLLPSGRLLCYPEPQVEDGKLSYMGVDQYTRKWQRIKTYGGKLAENITQAVARDVIAHGLVKTSEHFWPVLTVHDEVIVEAGDGGQKVNDSNANLLCHHLTMSPEWADGLPLAAAGFAASRYGKE